MWQRRRQEEHRQEEAQRVERERRLQTRLMREEGVHRRRYGRQVQEELEERQTESALLKVHYKLSLTFVCRLWQLLCLLSLLVGRGGEVKQSKTTSTRGENG